VIEAIWVGAILLLVVGVVRLVLIALEALSDLFG
jgi:hypothetical protein